MRKVMKKLGVVFLLCVTILLWSGQAMASPLFSLNSESDWDTAVTAGTVAPVTVEYAAIAAHYGPLAADYVYVMPVITAMSSAASGEPDDGLLMTWGDTGVADDVLQVAAWEYVYDVDPDLTGTTLNLYVTPPTGILSVSLTLTDQFGGWASWTWDIPPLLANLSNSIVLDPTLMGIQSGSTTFFKSAVFDVTKVVSIQADELAVGSALWSTFPSGPPATGTQPWNYWSTLSVTPEPATICLLGLGVLLLRKRRA